MHVAIERLALRIVRDSGGTKLRALADIRAAVESNTWTCIRLGSDPEDILERAGGWKEMPTWREIGEDLGVSAQAAHRKYSSKKPSTKVEDR